MKARTDITINGKLYRKGSDFPASVHAVPFLYYMLYTFLLYQMVLDATGARNNPARKRFVETAYVIISLVVYGVIYLLQR